MGFFRALYGAFVAKPGGGLVLAFLDLLVMAASTVGTVWIRGTIDNSFGIGGDILIGFVIGLTIIAVFNSMVYIGAFGHPASREHRS